MKLSSNCADILQQLRTTVGQLNPEQYSLSLPVLSGSSVGMHVRHIAELLGCLVAGYEKGIVNYDDRERNLKLETDPVYAACYTLELENQISEQEDLPMLLKANYSLTANTDHFIKTSYYRELAYNIEHTIHHMAILRIALHQHFPHIRLNGGFGIAPSTLRYKQVCAQ